MLINYFKIAIAVLKRRKFFTFISLFGISFSLTILMVLTAAIDHLVSPSYPDVHRDRSLYSMTLKLTDPKEQGQRTGPFNYHFLHTYVESMKTPEAVAISSIFAPSNTYVNNQKLVIDIKYTNEGFWKVLQFQFLEGKPYTQAQIDAGERVAVITESTRDRYFGKGVPAVGKLLETDNVQYRIAGVVKSVAITQVFAYGDMYLPWTVSQQHTAKKGYNGMFIPILLAPSKADLPAMQAEYAHQMSKVPMPHEHFTELESHAKPYLTTFTRMLLGKHDSDGTSKLMIYLGAFLLFFLLLPTLNLVNLNLSRILERASEIGVRKAFGASSGTLVVQFIVENVILTLIGGIIGMALSFIVIGILNQAELLSHVTLSLNYKVLAISMVICLVFGCMSGVYPAWRMSRMQIATALKTV
ncbi:ABC transporter permease [Chitinophaga rhizosphaerae]|uniref:ABC transporter permease n=1 Tax=Chitinophaga rhizosphaerae TaxID=1864947 RepID=UPI000F7FD5C6|nr:ABC transporter permease [Chitinophaga rhizosphaerae]